MWQKNILRHFLSWKTLKFGLKSVDEKMQYSFQMPCDVCKWTYEKQESLPLMGVTTQHENEEYTVNKC